MSVIKIFIGGFVNRIKISPLATASSETKTQVSAPPLTLDNLRKLQTVTNDESSLFVPMHYEQKHAYPLIVWLHANGDEPDQILRVMPHLSIRNYVAIAPGAPVGNRHTGFHWEQDSECVDLAHDSIMKSVDDATMRFNVAPHRVFLAGAGAGATMAFRIAFQRPELFAGVISLNGPLPIGNNPLSDWSRCRDLPVFWAHGRRSVEFGQDQLCKQLRLLHIAGFSVTLRQYPTGDELAPNCFSDVNHWIMEQIESSVGA